MSQSVLDLILRTKKQGTGVKDTEKEFKSLGDAADALKTPLAGAAAGVAILVAVYQASVAPTLEYAGQVRDLSRNIGATAEESSKLIQAADDMGISADSLSSALKAAIKNGTQPTIENIARLSDEYLKIQDPIARSEFLMTKFGKSGLELGALMERGSEGIREMGEEAEMVGLVMSEQNVQSARELELALDSLADLGFAKVLAAGNAVVPVLVAAADATILLATWNQQLTAAVQEHGAQIVQTATTYTAYIDEQTRALVSAGQMSEAERALALENEGNNRIMQDLIATNVLLGEAEFNVARLTNGTAEEMRLKNEIMNISKMTTEEYTEQQKMLTNELGELNAMIGGQLGPSLERQKEKQGELITKQQELQAEIEKYTNLNGAAIPPAENLSEIQNQQALTVAEYAAAQSTLADAQAAVINGQVNQYGNEEALKIKVLEAQVALDKKKDSLDEVNQSLAIAGGGTANYSTKLTELKGEYDEITGTIGANADVHDEATKRILFNLLQQRAAADGLSSAELQGLTTVAAQWGLIDEATATATTKMDAALAGLSNGGPMETFLSQMYDLGGPAKDQTLIAGEQLATSFSATGDAIEDKLLARSKDIVTQTKTKIPEGFKATINATKDYTKLLLEEMTPGGPIERYIIGLSKIAGEATAAGTAISKIPGLPGVIGDLPKRALGGPVEAGSMYTVGERGPETFIAPSNGFILPNGQSPTTTTGGGGGFGGTTIININIYESPLSMTDQVKMEMEVIPMLKRELGLI